MKKLALVFAVVIGIGFSSVAANNEVSPYYIKELKELVKEAPTPYAENVATHYLKIAKASKKINAADFVLNQADIDALKLAFGSSPELVAMINEIAKGQADLVLTLETVGEPDIVMF
jgi:hypothetical protein